MQIYASLETPPPVPPKSEILAMLQKHHVPLHLWGTKNHRSLDDLIKYMTEDRVHFHNGSEMGITLDVYVAVVLVTHQFGGEWFELYEEKQIFPNGDTLHRSGFNGIAETLKRYEHPRDGAIRCLAEELKFRDQNAYELSGCLNVEHRDSVKSEKWPGLHAAYHRHVFECDISRKLYKPQGYVEMEGNRTIVFKWKPRDQVLLNI